MLKKFYPGIIVILGMGFGSLLTALLVRSWVSPALEIGYPTNVHAATSANSEGFSASTGRIDENIEALFLLDELTGDLTCHVVSTFNGKFFARMQHNVLGDLDIDDDKNTRLLMVTGGWNFRNQTGQLRPSDTVIYVIDATTGNFAAYFVPWSKTISNKGRKGKHIGGFTLLGTGKSRATQVQP